MSIGTRISDMDDIGGTLPAGTEVPVVSGGSNYRFNLATAIGLLATTAALAASSGASLLGWIHSGTGAVARTVQDKLRETSSIEDFGGGVGVADNTAALRAAVTALGSGGTLEFRSGKTYTFDGAAWLAATGYLELPDSFTLKAKGRGRARIVFSGTAVSYFLRATNASNVTIEGLDIDGNGCAGPILALYMTDAASADMEDCEVVDCVLTGSKSVSGHIDIINSRTNTTYVMRGMKVNGGKITGATGSVVLADRTDITKSHAAIYISATAGGQVVDTQVDKIRINGDNLKIGIVGFGDIDGVLVNKPRILNLGATYVPASADRGYYGIAFYRFVGITNPPRNLQILRPSIIAPWENGIYLQNCSYSLIDRPIIWNQGSSYETSIKRAAIYINGGYRNVVRDGDFVGNYRDIAFTGPDAGSADADHEVIGGTSQSSVLSAIYVGPGQGSNLVWRGLTVSGFRDRAGKFSVYFDGDATGGAKKVKFVDCDFEASQAGGKAVETVAATFASGDIQFINCKLKGTVNAVDWTGIATGGVVRFQGCAVETGSSGADFNIGVAQTKLQLVSNHFKATAANKVTIATVGDGSMSFGNLFDGDSVTAGHFMKAAPTHNSPVGATVQIALPTSGGNIGYVSTGASTWKTWGVIA